MSVIDFWITVLVVAGFVVWFNLTIDFVKWLYRNRKHRCEWCGNRFREKDVVLMKGYISVKKEGEKRRHFCSVDCFKEVGL